MAFPTELLDETLLIGLTAWLLRGWITGRDLALV